ncbi:MAG: GrdX protein [Candidatus Cloacimonadota bacterium]|nr:MAG: GrdX protein [Candidatus Cloacimonadota bacterium]
MTEKGILITNNSDIIKLNSEKIKVIFYEDLSGLDVLKKARDFIHKGHILLTHPLHSSLKPNETPYRTVMIGSEKKSSVDIDSLLLIEKALESYQKFMKNGNVPEMSSKMKKDFRLIDFDLIKHAVT